MQSGNVSVIQNADGSLEVQKPILRQGRLDTQFTSDSPYWISALIKGAGCVSMTMVANGNVSGLLAAYNNLTAASAASPNGALWVPLRISAQFQSQRLSAHTSGGGFESKVTKEPGSLPCRSFDPNDATAVPGSNFSSDTARLIVPTNPNIVYVYIFYTTPNSPQFGVVDPDDEDVDVSLQLLTHPVGAPGQQIVPLSS